MLNREKGNIAFDIKEVGVHRIDTTLSIVQL